MIDGGESPRAKIAFDFRSAQTRAQRRTLLFILLFILVVLSVSGTAAFFGMLWSQQLAWTPFLLWMLAITTPIVLAAFWRAWRLGGDGASVAVALGAVEIDRGTRNLYQRRYRNVVEETAIAADLPTPRIFILRGEQGINAFAAGRRPDHAAVAVSHGALAKLSREELAGVIAHEMAHIRNADVRLNTDIAAMVYGLAFLTMLGWRLLGTGRTGWRNANGIGLFLIATGFIGWLGARLIQAALSRGREHLADATAVEFTRNPAGLVGALRKIAATTGGSRIVNPHAEQARHMFFGSIGKGGGLQTHPPIEERIRRLDPSYNARKDPLRKAGDGAILRSTRSQLVAEFGMGSRSFAGRSLVPQVGGANPAVSSLEASPGCRGPDGGAVA